MLIYTGFTVVPGGREYGFSVPGYNTPARSFTVMIKDAAFRPGLLKYQEGPEICYGKLLTALAAEQSDHPLGARQDVTESEVTEYQASGRTKLRRWSEERRLEAKRRFRAKRAEGLLR